MKTINFVLNGEAVTHSVDDNWTLVYFLREVLHLTGTKEGCGEGECGACTVLVDGLSVNSCIYPAVSIDGKTLLTIEGVAKDNELDRIQQAFVRNGAIQCGFCSPGMIMSVKAMLDRGVALTEEDVKIGISGNLCRCTGYKAIFKAVEDLQNQKMLDNI